MIEAVLRISCLDHEISTPSARCRDGFGDGRIAFICAVPARDVTPVTDRIDGDDLACPCHACDPAGEEAHRTTA